MSLRPAAAPLRACSLVLLVALAACAERQALPNDPTGRLFARGLDEISDLYIAPVSSRRLVLGAAARLSRLDDKFSVAETPGPDKTYLVLSYAGNEVAGYPIPSHDDPHDWGAMVGRLVADAKAVSPSVAALPEDQIDKTLFDGITAGLDRFSRYSSPDVASDQRAARDGFGGIGVTLDTSNENFRITAVAPHGPAQLAGVKPDDRLVAIDKVPTAGRSHSDVVHALRGPILSTVEVTIYRPSLTQNRTFHLQRELVILPTVTVSRDGDIAIVQVASFNQNTTQQIVEALGNLKREMGPQLHGIVLDLRGDPGGLLDQAVSLVDLFIPSGPIVATIGRHPASRQYFEASGDSIAPQIPVVVLINGGSASSSEIVAAALAGCRPRGRRRQRLLWQGHGADRLAAAERRRADIDLGPARHPCGISSAPARRRPDAVHERSRGRRRLRADRDATSGRVVPGRAPPQRGRVHHSTKTAGLSCAALARLGQATTTST